MLSSVFFEGVGNATACVMRDKIYVTGGHYGYRGTCTYEKIQLYSPDVNEWTIITTSPHPGMRKGRGSIDPFIHDRMAGWIYVEYDYVF